MFRIPGQAAKDVCDPNAGVTRRDVLRVGGAGMLGMSLGTLFPVSYTHLTLPTILLV